MQLTASIPDDAAGDAIRRADTIIQAHRIACEQPVTIEGDRLFLTWNTHHSNMLIMAFITGLASISGAPLPKATISDVMRCIYGLDRTQKATLNAIANHSGDTTDTLYDCVKRIIRAERLEPYFDDSDARRGDDPKHWHYAIRPVEMPEGYTPAKNGGVFDHIKKQAQDDGLDPMQRVALIAVMSLYNATQTDASFKGRGWAFHAAMLGEYCRDRFQSQPDAALALLRACVVYPGW